VFCLSPAQVIQLLEKPRDPALKYVFVDTPGQIEIFTWSASGQLITGACVSTQQHMAHYHPVAIHACNSEDILGEERQVDRAWRPAVFVVAVVQQDKST